MLNVTSTYHHQSSSGPRRFFSNALTRFPRIPHLAGQSPYNRRYRENSISSRVLAFKIMAISVLAVMVLTVWPASDESRDRSDYKPIRKNVRTLTPQTTLYECPFATANPSTVLARRQKTLYMYAREKKIK